jgi:hypothetical protein
MTCMLEGRHKHHRRSDLGAGVTATATHLRRRAGTATVGTAAIGAADAGTEAAGAGRSRWASLAASRSAAGAILSVTSPSKAAIDFGPLARAPLQGGL